MMKTQDELEQMNEEHRKEYYSIFHPIKTQNIDEIVDHEAKDISILKNIISVKFNYR